MTGHSIFEHAQNGHAPTRPEPNDAPGLQRPQPKDDPALKPPQPLVKPKRRVGSARSWAVEAGLGLGPQFKGR